MKLLRIPVLKKPFSPYLWNMHEAKQTDRGSEPARDTASALAYSSSLVSRIEKLALEERDAVRRRDWPAARTAAQERLTLQEARHRAAARRLV